MHPQAPEQYMQEVERSVITLRNTVTGTKQSHPTSAVIREAMTSALERVQGVRRWTTPDADLEPRAIEFYSASRKRVMTEMGWELPKVESRTGTQYYLTVKAKVLTRSADWEDGNLPWHIFVDSIARGSVQFEELTSSLNLFMEGKLFNLLSEDFL